MIVMEDVLVQRQKGILELKECLAALLLFLQRHAKYEAYTFGDSIGVLPRRPRVTSQIPCSSTRK